MFDIRNWVRRLLDDPIPAFLRLRMAELSKGNYIVQPGTVPWLPTSDWGETDCVSISGGEVRLVAIQSRRQGSFRRLVEGIQASGLTPVVICPLDHMREILMRWGWQRTEVGSTFADREEQWRPPSASRRFYQCPFCGAVSYHPKDIEERYCGRCHQFAEGGVR